MLSEDKGCYIHQSIQLMLVRKPEGFSIRLSCNDPENDCTGYRGDAKGAQSALEEALLSRYRTLLSVKERITLRSDNGLVFTSRDYTNTARRYGLTQAFIRPHTPQQNGMVERLIRTIKEQCVFLNRFDSLSSARDILGQWFKHYSNHRPHQALGMKTPSEFYKLVA